jgi:hypothetical protein
MDSERGYFVSDTGVPVGKKVADSVPPLPSITIADGPLTSLQVETPDSTNVVSTGCVFDEFSEPSDMGIPFPSSLAAVVDAVLVEGDTTPDTNPVEHPATIPVLAPPDVMPSSTDPKPPGFDVVVDPLEVAVSAGVNLRRSALPSGLTLEGDGSESDSTPPAPIVVEEEKE